MSIKALGLFIVVGLMLGGCSGGSDDSPTSAPSSVSLTVSPKALNFSWTAAHVVDHYRILVNPDGVSGFTVDPNAANIANTATSHTLVIPVHKTNWLAAQYIIESCNAAETSCLASPNKTLALIDSVAATAYVKASNTEVSDYFGDSVSLSADGNTLAVGAFAEDSAAATGVGGNQLDNTASSAGAVYVFIRSNTTWIQQAYVKAPNTDANDWFGASVSLSGDGNTLAVGARYEGSAATDVGGNQLDNTASGAGAVYVFNRLGTTWTQQAYVKASNTDVNDQFGHSVSLSGDGNTLAVGARYEGSAAKGIDGNQLDNTAFNSGAVYVFIRSNTTWIQQAYVKASNTDVNDNFGASLSLSGDGNTLVVGSYFEDSTATDVGGNQLANTASSAGAVYVFSRLNTTWAQQAYVKASNTDVNDQFGNSVSLSGDGNTLAVGARYEGSAVTGIDGNQLDNTASGAGAVYVFSRLGTTWTQQAYVKASNTDVNDYFGNSVSLSGDGNTMAVGAYFEGSVAIGIDGNQLNNTAFDAGAVYVFSRSGTTWIQQAYVKASNTEDNDLFGARVSLSGDGNTMAVGAFGERSAATGVGGNQLDNTALYAGAVYVY